MAGPRIITFGCRLNAFESEAMRRLAQAAGLDSAVIVNTCAVTAEAQRQARQAIRRARREHPERPLVVTGCAAQTAAAEFAAMPEADAVLGNQEKLEEKAWQAVARALNARPRRRAATGGQAEGQTGAEIEAGRPVVQVSDIMQARRIVPLPVSGMRGRTRAFVQVQTGCNHRCTFCIIPFGRGNARSLPAEDVIAQVRAARAAGHREVVLTGVDLTSWGEDLGGAERLGHLVARILVEVPQLERLRVSSIDVAEIDEEFLRVLAGEERLMPHLHLSLQAGDDLILKRMKRRHSRAQTIEFCRRVRELRPDVAFGADIIAGFPTETEAMFANTLELVDECDLVWLHVFPYSPREGTPAARMPQVDTAVRKERAARLREAGARRRRRHLAAQKGLKIAVLVEEPGLARAPDNAQVWVDPALPAGEITPVRIVGHDGERLIAEGAAVAAAAEAEKTGAGGILPAMADNGQEDGA